MINALKFVKGIILFFILIAGCIREDPQVRNTSAVKDMTTQEIIAQRTAVAGTTPEKFSLTSSGFKQGDSIPSKYTCDGEDVSPQLSWGTALDGTKTIALIVDDPDAPRGIFTHWVLFNLPANKTGLPEGLPKIDRLDGGGIQGKNDFGKIGYNGPCPPKRHTYRFIVYALDVELNLKPGAARQEVLKAIEGHVLSKTELDGKYGK
jgi:Raf kinase inhibitor-like YbhB/YbcL family protein